MNESDIAQTPEGELPLKIPYIGWLASLLLLAGLVYLTVTHLGEATEFVTLLKQARPWWIAFAILMQIGTYVCAGGVWKLVTKSAGHYLKISSLARLSIEKLSINQLIPTGGVAGNLVVVRAMRRMGVPGSIAMEALLVDVLSYFGALACMTILAVGILWYSGDLTPVLLSLVTTVTILIACVPLIIWWILRHRSWHPPKWLSRHLPLAKILDAISKVTASRVRSPRLLLGTVSCHIGVLLLDAATLWAMMQAIGVSISPVTALTAFIVALMTGTISFLPGGIGSFEAAAVSMLVFLKVPVEAALTGTLLLRGTTLWGPLIPGILLARQEFTRQKRV